MAVGIRSPQDVSNVLGILILKKIEIKGIPVLKGETAKEFVKNAELAKVNRGTVDFSKQVATAKKILAKAKL